MLPEGGGDRGHDLTDEAVQIGIGGPLDVQVPTADVIDGLVVYHEGAIGVFQRGMGGQDGVVRLHHSCCYLHHINRVKKKKKHKSIRAVQLDDVAGFSKTIKVTSIS